MELGITGRKAVVCGASRGLGYAIANALAAEGVDLVMCARDSKALEEAALTIRDKSGVNIETVAADLAVPAGRARLLAACSDPDILVHNGGWPAFKPDYRAWTRADWDSALDAMMMAPIDLIRGVVEGMIERKFGRIVTVTSRFVKEPKLEHALSVSPRLGLAGYVAGLAREIAPHNVTINAMLPGIFATETQWAYGRSLAAEAGKPLDEVWAARESTNAARRFGKPEEFASLCAWLCSAQAGFITGQNIVMDGGGYPGVL
ncbi:MAG: SDR family oxidoreductase [Burkholderiales bacterium]